MCKEDFLEHTIIKFSSIDLKHDFLHQKIDIDTFTKNNYLLVGADQYGNSQLRDSEYTKKIILCLGSEAKGFDKSFKNKLDKLISIKKIGQGESLNVAIAGSILIC